MEITKYSICHPMSKLRNKGFKYIDLVLEKALIGCISFFLNKPAPTKKFQKTLRTPYYQYHFKICSKIFEIFIKKDINYHMGSIIMSLGPNKCPHRDWPKRLPRFSHEGLYCNILQYIAIYWTIQESLGVERTSKAFGQSWPLFIKSYPASEGGVLG